MIDIPLFRNKERFELGKISEVSSKVYIEYTLVVLFDDFEDYISNKANSISTIPIQKKISELCKVFFKEVDIKYYYSNKKKVLEKLRNQIIEGVSKKINRKVNLELLILEDELVGFEKSLCQPFKLEYRSNSFPGVISIEYQLKFRKDYLIDIFMKSKFNSQNGLPEVSEKYNSFLKDFLDSELKLLDEHERGNWRRIGDQIRRVIVNSLEKLRQEKNIEKFNVLLIKWDENSVSSKPILRHPIEKIELINDSKPKLSIEEEKKMLKLIGLGKVEDAMDKLLVLLEGSNMKDLYYELIKIQNQWNSVNNELLKNLLTQDQANVEKSKILNRLINFIKSF